MRLFQEEFGRDWERGMILVFGKNGQVTTKLSLLKSDALGRNQVDLTDPKACEHYSQLKRLSTLQPMQGSLRR